MITKNDILSSKFLDFEIFSTSNAKNGEIIPAIPDNCSTLVIYKSEAEQEELDTFLANILTAAKLDMSKDVFLLKLTSEQLISFGSLRTKDTISKVLLFGIHPHKAGINLDLKLYVPIKLQGFEFMVANTLSEIKSDVNKKKALWASLQEIYLK